MEKIEKYRKFYKNLQTIGMIVIVLAGMFVIYWFGMRNASEDSSNINTITYAMLTIMVLFMFMTFVGVPQQNKLLKMIILESLNGLNLKEITFNKKKGYSKESFLKLNLAPANFANYGNSDYYSFKYKDLLIESTTIRAYDEYKIPKQKGVKKSKATKKIDNYFFGRVYLIPISLKEKLNVYGKKHPTISKKKDLENSEYNVELPLKIKKYQENFEIFYKDEKPNINVQSFLEKLLSLKLASKGPVSCFVRNDMLVLCLDNHHHYKEVELKDKIDENLIRDYKKDVSIVLTFINMLLKDFN